ncbi:MAG: hypothetical protein Tsb009_18040 [Planctomycetaceae bacterium]
MKRLQLFGVVSSLILLGGLACYLAGDDNRANAQSGFSRGSGGRAVPQTFEGRFWNYLQTVYYRNWAPAPGQGADMYPGQSPHGAHLKMYLNRIAAANPKTLPHGSIIIKENYGKDKKTLMAVTVMYRTKGYDPAHNDWYWVKYNPDGTVARTPPAKGNVPIAGRFKSCIECHSSAKGKDFVFVNDK